MVHEKDLTLEKESKGGYKVMPLMKLRGLTEVHHVKTVAHEGKAGTSTQAAFRSATRKAEMSRRLVLATKYNSQSLVYESSGIRCIFSVRPIMAMAELAELPRGPGGSWFRC